MLYVYKKAYAPTRGRIHNKKMNLGRVTGFEPATSGATT